MKHEEGTLLLIHEVDMLRSSVSVGFCNVDTFAVNEQMSLGDAEWACLSLIDLFSIPALAFALLLVTVMCWFRQGRLITEDLRGGCGGIPCYAFTFPRFRGLRIFLNTSDDDFAKRLSLSSGGVHPFKP